LLAGGKSISADMVLRSVGDSARYDVFQLAEAAAAGDASRALRMLLGLKSEGVEPALILWALARELRGLWQARERGRLRSTVRGSGWNLAATPTPRALSRLKQLPLARLLIEASYTDRVIKGLAMGDPWSALTGLAGGLAGALQATKDSGRVPV
jgi:DNA polymerase-3 subunit delta